VQCAGDEPIALMDWDSPLCCHRSLQNLRLLSTKRFASMRSVLARRNFDRPVDVRAPAGTYSELKANPKFYSDPDVNAAMRGVAGAGSAIQGGWLIKHAVAYPAIGAGIGALGGAGSGFFGAGKGEDPWSRAAEEAAFFGGGGLLAGAGAKWGRNALTNRAIRAAAPTLTGGRPMRRLRPRCGTWFGA
jgi:hypothetical protein